MTEQNARLMSKWSRGRPLNGYPYEVRNQPASEQAVACRLCGRRAHILAHHIRRVHDLTCMEYQAQFPGAEVTSAHYRAVRSELARDRWIGHRKQAPSKVRRKTRARDRKRNKRVTHAVCSVCGATRKLRGRAKPRAMCGSCAAKARWAADDGTLRAAVAKNGTAEVTRTCRCGALFTRKGPARWCSERCRQRHRSHDHRKLHLDREGR